MVTPDALLVIPVVVLLLLWLFLRADFIPGMLKGLVFAVLGFYLAYISSRDVDQYMPFALGGLFLGTGDTYFLIRCFMEEIIQGIKQIEIEKEQKEE